MATGASTADLAVVLIDARKGVLTQTRRHSYIVALLGVRQVILAVNKMDLVDHQQSVFDSIVDEYRGLAEQLGISTVHCVPMSALKGDNVVDHSDKMPWYDGPTFLHHLENVNISADRNLVDMRFPVQYVLRPNLNFRGFSGTIASGIIRVGDEVVSLPSRRTSRIKSIYGPNGEITEAFAPMAVTVTLEDEIDVSRGNMLVPVKNLPHVGNEFEAMIVWMHENPAQKGRSYIIKQTTNMVPGVLTDIRYKIDVNTMRKQVGPASQSAEGKEQSEENAVLHAPCSLQLNEIARAQITLHRPIAFDPYEKNRQTGAFILIDRMTNITVGAGMIVDRVVSKPKTSAPVSKNIVQSDSLVSVEDRQKLLNQKGATLWLTGLSGSGKSTIARQLERELIDMGHACTILDGDNVRHGLNRDLGFSMEDRTENIRRIAEVAHLFNDAGIIVITAFISPYRADRAAARDVIGSGFTEVFVDTPIAVCEQRDPKGLYKKARAGEIAQFTGITDPYEAPEKPELVLPTAEMSAEQSVDAIIAKLREEGIIG